MAVCHKLELHAYDRSGSGTSTGTLPAVNVAFSVGLGGSGFLSCEVDARAEPVASDDDMLDDCVVKVAIPLAEPGTSVTEVLAYAPRARNRIVHDGAGRKVARIQSAPTLWTAWAQDAILHTEANSIPQMAGEQRYFGYQSSIYDYASEASFTWSTPSATVGKQNATTGDRAGNPDGWPSALGDAYWITRPSGGDPAETRHLFVADCVVPTDCYLTVYFSADESSAVYFAGELVIQTSSSETGYQNIDTWSAWVTAGTYRVAVDKTSVVSRGGDGFDPILLAVASNTDNGSVDDILLVTNNSDWECHTMDPVDGEAPSLTPGQIMLELHSQADARGVDTWSAVTPTFTATTDSDSTAWGLREERTWRIGYDRYLDMVEGLGDLGVDVEITPDLDLNAYYERGADVSASVVIEALVDADTIVEDGVGVGATWLAVETQDGWVPNGLVNATGLATYGRREAALSLGNAPSVAQGVRLGQRVLDERLAVPTSEWSVDFYATTGVVPFVDFNLGDTVGVKIGATTTDRVVLEIGGQAASVNSIIRWTIKTGPVL